MTPPRPADLDRETQRNLAYAALASLSSDERKVILYWWAEHRPMTFLACVEDFRDEGHLPDGWDQAHAG